MFCSLLSVYHLEIQYLYVCTECQLCQKWMLCLLSHGRIRLVWISEIVLFLLRYFQQRIDTTYALLQGNTFLFFLGSA